MEATSAHVPAEGASAVEAAVSSTLIERWAAVVPLCAALEAIGRQGASALLKIDGARADGEVYSVVVSGGRLREGFIRRDGADLAALLAEAVRLYVVHAERGSGPSRVVSKADIVEAGGDDALADIRRLMEGPAR